MSAAPTLTNALDALRFEVIAELAEMVGDLAVSTLESASNHDRLLSVAYLTLLSRSVAKALCVAAELGNAEATA